MCQKCHLKSYLSFEIAIIMTNTIQKVANHKTMYIHTYRLKLIVAVYTEFFLKNVGVVHDAGPESERERLGCDIV